MNVYEHMLTLLRRYHANADPERLAGEMQVEGYNVVSDFLRREVGQPWIWSERMAEFYRATDAFVYELLVWHHKPWRIEWRTQLARRVKQLLPDGGKVLCLGDGLGYDALAIAAGAPGVEVTSFELPGFSSAFAARVVDDAGLAGQVSAVNDPGRLTQDAYDVVTSLHVLEHLPEPSVMIRDIAGYLKPAGCALIAEAFTVVDASRPTHLASNLRHAGRTIALFEDRGFAFDEMLPYWTYRFVKEPPRRLGHLALKARFWVAGMLARKRFAREFPDGTADLARAIRLELNEPPQPCAS